MEKWAAETRGSHWPFPLPTPGVQVRPLPQHLAAAGEHAGAQDPLLRRGAERATGGCGGWSAAGDADRHGRGVPPCQERVAAPQALCGAGGRPRGGDSRRHLVHLRCERVSFWARSGWHWPPWSEKPPGLWLPPFQAESGLCPGASCREGAPTLFSGTGGFAQGQTLSAMQSYLPRLRCWVRNRPMAFARCDHGMATVGDRIFCLGGRALANVGGICSLPCGLPGLPEAQLGALCHAPWFCPMLWFFAGPAVGPCERGGVLLPRH